MPQPTRQTDRHVQAVLAGLDILDCLLDSPDVSIKELMDKTGLTRNRVMRLCGTLEHRGYLSHDEEVRRYGLGPKIIFLGKAYERHKKLVSLARPFLRRLVHETGESASLYVREGLERMVLAREEGTQAVRYSIEEGQRMELFAGAGGKVLLAFAPPDVVDNLMNGGGLPRLTDNTLTSPTALSKELETIRRNCVAVSSGERQPEVGAVAAPIFDHTGGVVGAIGIAGPKGRIGGLTRQKGTTVITDAAKELSKALGWKHNCHVS